MRIGLCLAALAASVAGVCAQPVAPVNLSPGTVGVIPVGNWTTSNASDVAWFTFSTDLNTVVDIDINRILAAEDLIAVLFQGDVSGRDMTALSPDGKPTGLITGPAQIDTGLSRVQIEDDSEDDDLGGPFGDPRFNEFLVGDVYSIMVTCRSEGVNGACFVVSSPEVSPRIRPRNVGRLQPGPFYATEDDLNPASSAAWLKFSLDYKMNVDLDITREIASVDPIAVLFAGEGALADMNFLSPDGRINGLLGNPIGTVFGPDGTFSGPLTVVAEADDTNPDAFGGPGGDPQITRVLDAGDYTLMIAALTNEAGGPVRVKALTPRPVPLLPTIDGPFFAPTVDAPVAGAGWHSFTVDARSHVEIAVIRQSATPDPVAFLFAGDPNGYPFSLTFPDEIRAFFDRVEDPLSLVAIGDDEAPDPFDGPFGDPRFDEILEPGVYSMAVGVLNQFGGGEYLTELTVTPACAVADLALPFGVLDLADINAFIGGFLNQQAIADLAPPAGVFDLSDISAFIASFTSACP